MFTGIVEEAGVVQAVIRRGKGWSLQVDKDKHERTDATLDKLRAGRGRNVVSFGNEREIRDTAPMRISATHISDLERGLAIPIHHAHN